MSLFFPPFSLAVWTAATRTMSGGQKNAVLVKDVPAQEFVVSYAQHLKRSGKIQVPKWADYAKTGSYKELSPLNPDWFYIRAGKCLFQNLVINCILPTKFSLGTASMARKIYLRGGLGVGMFRRIYGGSKNNGTKPSHFAKSSGGVARAVLRELERIKVVEKDPKG